MPVTKHPPPQNKNKLTQIVLRPPPHRFKKSGAFGNIYNQTNGDTAATYRKKEACSHLHTFWATTVFCCTEYSTCTYLYRVTHGNTTINYHTTPIKSKTIQSRAARLTVGNILFTLSSAVSSAMFSSSSLALSASSKPLLLSLSLTPWLSPQLSLLPLLSLHRSTEHGSIKHGTTKHPSSDDDKTPHFFSYYIGRQTRSSIAKVTADDRPSSRHPTLHGVLTSDYSCHRPQRTKNHDTKKKQEHQRCSSRAHPSRFNNLIQVCI